MQMAIQHKLGFGFKTFATYQEFKSYHNSIEDSSHYEVISGHQSLYFDFDGAFDVDLLVSRIVKKFEGEKIRIDLYSSSDSAKSSYHVIVKGIFFKSHVECGMVACELASDLPAFDSVVYSSKRNLRLLGSRKIDSTRVKKFDTTLYRHPSYTCRMENDQLYMSLVTGIIDAKLIEIETPNFPREEEGELSANEIADMMSRVNSVYPDVFTKREVKGTSIVLKRQKASSCNICDRVHQNENALVFKRKTSIMYLCFRNPKEITELEGDELIQVKVRVSSEKKPTETAESLAEKLKLKFSFDNQLA